LLDIVGISGVLWRDNVTMGEHAKTLSQLHES
jgi:hypothetical protein